MSGVGDELVREHVRRWAEELVDLTRRNRLLYFKHTASASLEFAQAAPDVVARLTKDWGFYLPPPPPPPPDPARPVAFAEPEPIVPPAFDELVVRMSPERDAVKIERGLKNLAAKTQAEFLDAGLWVLYLGLGRLNWVDVDGREAVSPLLLVPVELKKDGPSGRWRLTSSADGEPALNPALAVKLERDFAITLPNLDEGSEPELANVLAVVREATAGTDWTVDETAVLSTFTFAKEVIYRDLRDSETTIIDHDMVRLLAEGPSSTVAVDLDFAPEDEATLDDRHPPEDLAFVLDADATQRQCLIAARAGRSFVMDGPPGTGKSQTITNVIAQLIADGKTVLFVSEKAAALEVVQNRLAQLSLDPFVLALHSHSATRKAVAQELGKALLERPTARPRFDATQRAQLQRSRGQLSAYATATNDVRHPLERTLHDVIGRAAQLDVHPSMPTPTVDVLGLTPADLSALLERADQLGRAWGPVTRGDDFVWRELRPVGNDNGGEAGLRRRVELCQIAMDALETAASPVYDELRLPEPSGPADVQRILDLLGLIERRMPVGPAWLSTTTPDAVADTIEALADRLRGQVELGHELDRTAVGWSTLSPGASNELQGLEHELAHGRPGVVLSDGAGAADLAAVATSLEAVVTALAGMVEPVGVLSQAFGLPAQASIDQAHRLAELGQLVGSATAPEPEWLNPVFKEALDEARRVLADLLTAYRGRREALRTVFSEGVLELDLQALNARFTEVHTGIKKLGGAYRADKRALAAVTISGKVTKDVLAKLDEAIGWQQLSARLAHAEERHGPRLGSHYYASRDDADIDEIERAVAVADRALALAAGDVVPINWPASSAWAPLPIRPSPVPSGTPSPPWSAFGPRCRSSPSSSRFGTSACCRSTRRSPGASGSPGSCGMSPPTLVPPRTPAQDPPVSPAPERCSPCGRRTQRSAPRSQRRRPPSLTSWASWPRIRPRTPSIRRSPGCGRSTATSAGRFGRRRRRCSCGPSSRRRHCSTTSSRSRRRAPS